MEHRWSGIDADAPAQILPKRRRNDPVSSHWSITSLQSSEPRGTRASPRRSGPDVQASTAAPPRPCSSSRHLSPNEPCHTHFPQSRPLANRATAPSRHALAKPMSRQGHPAIRRCIGHGHRRHRPHRHLLTRSRPSLSTSQRSLPPRFLQSDGLAAASMHSSARLHQATAPTSTPSLTPRRDTKHQSMDQ